MEPPPLPSKKQIAYPFETEFSYDEHAFAQEVLEDNTKSKIIGCFLMIGAWIIFVIAKLATIHVSFVLIPFVVLAIFLHQYCGMRVWRLKHGGGILLWLRRFHRPDLRQFPFATLLQSVVDKELTPITIQDSTYKLWWYSVIAKGVIPLSSLMLVGACTAIMIAMLTGALIYYLIRFLVSDNLASMIAGIGIFFIAIVLIIFLPYYLISRASFHKLVGENHSTKFAKFIRRTIAGKTTHSLQIFKCDDDCWQEIVESALRNCRVVLIDVSSLGENVEWELRQAARLVDPKRIILCCATKHGRLIYDEVELIKKLLHIFGEIKLKEIRRITYEIPTVKQGTIKRITRDVLSVAILRHSDDFVKIQRAVTLANNGVARDY